MFIAAAIGLTAGVFSGLLGIGGGIIMIPALVFLWDIHSIWRREQLLQQWFFR